MRFKNGDYKAEFKKAVIELSYNNVADRTERMRLIDELIEEYITDTGERPDHRQLERLASAILYEDLQGDTRPNKSRVEDAPIFTDSQYDRRQNAELYGSKSDILLETIGSDGTSHAAPTRSNKELSRNLQVLRQ